MSYFYTSNGVEVCSHEHRTLGDAHRCAASRWPMWSVYMAYTDYVGRRVRVRVDSEEWLDEDIEVEDLIDDNT